MYPKLFELAILLISLQYFIITAYSYGLKDLPKDCGRFKHRKRHRISAGYTAKPGEYPSFVHIRAREIDGVDAGYCGGTILSEHHILTAAHCVYNRHHDTERPVKVYFLSRIAQDKDEALGIAPIKVCRSKKFPVHMEDTEHDIAIIKLEKKIQFTKEIQPACFTNKLVNLKEKVEAIGLGETGEGEPNYLQVLPVQREKCDPESNALICFLAFNPNHIGDTCKGDSGAGLFRTIDGRSYVVAVTSRGISYCRKGRMGLSVNGDLYNSREDINEMLNDCA